MTRSLFMILALIVLCAAPTFAVGDEAPSWLKESAAVPVPSYRRDVPAVVLRNEQEVKVDSSGRITVTTTFAVRILLREGRSLATARELYLTGTEKVKEIRAWLIRSDGQVKKYDGDLVADVISNPNDIYDEYRLKLILAEDDADEGSVFGYRSVTEATPLFFQDVFGFQDRFPTLLARYSLVLPTGWQASGVTVGHANVEPTVTGSTFTWQLQNLAPIPPEPRSPSVASMAPRIYINYTPPANATAVARSFSSWTEVSKWQSELHEPQSIPDDRIAIKVKELTAGATTELDKIKAIARFVQNLQYVSIDTGVGYGNGYRPHAATQVLGKSYGDCKDKANLMRTMLKVLKITAYSVGIYSSDSTHVQPAWPSPRQFDHCIIAIKVSDAVQLPTVINHEKLGRLLIFDATAESTPVGDLPEEEQGSYALIAAGDQGTLERMPVMPPDSSNMDRLTEINLAGDGSVTATIKEKSIGQSAVFERSLFRGLSNTEYTKMVESWIASNVTGASISKVEPVDNQADGKFALNVEFSARSYAQSTANLLFFNPAVIVNRTNSLSLTATQRTAPVVLQARSFSETVRIKLPVGFQVDEMPAAVKLETPFGNYAANYEEKDGQVVFTRKLTQRAGNIPAEQYEKVRSFFAAIRSAEQVSVVLMKK